ncbi:MAG: DMT family transporter [Pseudomonadota bacterium]|nr:DMT family transporter [Pseudomonadota bacterium]
MTANPQDRPAGGQSTVSRPAAWGLLSLVIVLWGANWTVMKVGLASIPPLTFAASRMVMGAAILAAIAAALGQLRRPSRGDWPIVLGVGLIQMGAFMALTTFALQYVPAGRSALLAYTTPLWVVPIAALVLHERLSPRKTAGFVLGVGGIIILFNPLGFDWTDRNVLIGNGLLIFAALLWAVLIVQIRGHRWQGTPLSLGPWQFAVGGCLLIPLALLVEDLDAIRWSAELGWVLLYNGPLATAFCFWAIVTVNRALPAVTTSLGSLGVPAFGILTAAVVLGEPVTPTTVLGFASIVGGLLLVFLADRGHHQPAAPTADRAR